MADIFDQRAATLKQGDIFDQRSKKLAERKENPHSFFNREARAPGALVGAVSRNPKQALAESAIQGTIGFIEPGLGGPIQIPQRPGEEPAPTITEFLRQKAGVTDLPEKEREEIESFGILANILAPFLGEAALSKLKAPRAPKIKGGEPPSGGGPPPRGVFEGPNLSGEYPPPPGGTPPAPGRFEPGSTIPETKSAFGEKENIVKELHKVETPPKLGIEARLANTQAKAPSLQGRVSEAQELGNVVSKQPFETEAQAGRQIAKDVTEARNAEKELVREKYKKAEEVTSTHDSIYPKLAKENEDRIARLESLEKRSTGEEAVYQDALALRRMIGEPDALKQANADRLMKQANSFSQKVKYELPYAGYKGEIKTIVHEINQSVIESLEQAGKNSSLVKEADRTFARFADRFMGDEIMPFFQKKILNPEALAKTTVLDAGTYRAVKDAIGSRTSPLVNKIDREVVHSLMDKYYQKPDLVNTKEYVKDLKNLAEKIGKEKTAEVDHFLRQKQLNAERKAFGERKLKEAEVSKQGLKGRETKKPEPIKFREPIAKTPEQLDKLFKSRSDIRRLRREMKDKGLSKKFDELADKKVEEIFKEGGFGSKKVTGYDLQRIIDKEHEILSEFLGEEEVAALYKVAGKAAKNELTEEIIKQVAKSIGKLGANALGIGKILKLLPLNRI